ncbi:10048_t:CDS:2 [Ambispora gerdemannii]|uniref:10048_t:CDS:1 n=1 Tax=Ambispora gerdemannii TaxID=144530 RepID=A0A9N9C6W3_9GLOM|nr:10048_t:CDS:2 [Ambispora gerdemannii]
MILFYKYLFPAHHRSILGSDKKTTSQELPEAKSMNNPNYLTKPNAFHGKSSKNHVKSNLRKMNSDQS